MSDTSSATETRFHALEGAKVALLDISGGREDRRKDRLIDVGLRDIAVCPTVDQLPSLLASQPADILLADLDQDREAVCRVIQDIRSQAIKTANPFVIVIGITREADRETVTKALKAGVDDLLSSPFTAAVLRESLRNQIEHRKDFIATSDYVGPDQRAADREPSDENLISIAVPNSLRHKATGDPDAALDESLVSGALRALGLQRCWHLSREIATLSRKARELVASQGHFPLLGELTDTLAAAIEQIERLVKAHAIQEMAGVIASAKGALLAIQEAGEGLRPRHFELLKVHADGLVVSLKANDEEQKILVTELERAVAGLRGLPYEPPAADNKKRYSWKLRLVAWWEGVDPGELPAAHNAG